MPISRYPLYGARFVDDEGKRFVTSCKDKSLCVYNTNMTESKAAWERTHVIPGIGTRWTITDFALSPNGRYLAYASIRPDVYIVDLDRPSEHQIILDLDQPYGGTTGIWSLTWSADGREIIVGTTLRENVIADDMNRYGCIMICDVQRRQVVDVIAAHEDDVNCVTLLQRGERNILLSASDDCFGTFRCSCMRIYAYLCMFMSFSDMLT